MTEAPDALMSVRDLRVKVRTTGTELLGGVDLDIGRGEILALVGESGCGKSLTGASLMRMLPPGLAMSAGAIALDGRDICHWPDTSLRGGLVARVPQDPQSSLNPVRPVGPQVSELVAFHRRLGEKAAREETVKLFKRVGLEPDRMQAYPFELSGGLCQRVAIARALAGAPKLIIADEPTTALDASTQALILDLLSELRERENLSILLITHDLGVVARMAGRVAVMYCGQLVEIATADDFFKGPLHPYAEGLLRSVPSLDRRIAVSPIKGSVPPMDALPSGCNFEPRCVHAFSECRTHAPRRLGCGQKHEAACFKVAERFGGAA